MNVLELKDDYIFVETQRFLWKSVRQKTIDFNTEGKGLWINYFGSTQTGADINALRLLAINPVEEFYLHGVGIDIDFPNISKKEFAEIIHGYKTVPKLQAFLTLQWEPLLLNDAIRFIWTATR